MAIQPLADGAIRGRSPASKPLVTGEASTVTPEDSANRVTESSLPSPDETAVLPTEADREPAANNDAFSAERQPPTCVSPHAPDSSHNPSEANFWLHMTETLDACFRVPTDSESDQPLDPVTGDMIAEAPRVMRMFLSHGDACAKIEALALDMVANGPITGGEDGPLKAFNNMLDNLEELQEKASMLESTITRLAGTVPSQGEKEQTVIESGMDGDKPTVPKQAAHSELKRIFAACLPVLRARIANLTMAQDLIDSAQENISISQRMQDLGIE